ncbi:MAG: hypothetical protein J5855_02895, partial [Mailhella sp.]|nr:hypothetical protein [Mailhella sp.]
YRPSYGRVVESHPRSCVMIATVNGEHGYLRDITGNRRFWVIKLRKTVRVKDWDFDDAYRAQFWAEAKEIWKSGEPLYLEGEAAEAAEEAQRGAMEQDDRVGMVEEYLELLLPENWMEMDLGERRGFIDDGNSIMHLAGTVRRDAVCNAEIWSECFGKDPRDMKAADSRGIGLIMSQIEGWERTGASRRIPPYGKQRVYVRKEWHMPPDGRNNECPDIPF